MKRLGWLLPLVVLAAGCTGGGGTSAPDASKGETKTDAGGFKVALLTPGPVSDAGWSAMAYDGLTQIKDKMGAEVNNQEAKDTQIKDAMRSYAQKGYNLVFGHGYEYNAPAIEVAKDFPKTVFISSSGGETAPNVGAFRFYLEQGFYLAGMFAALSSKTGTIAMIGGDDVPSIRSTFHGFEAGAHAAKPSVKVITIFTGNGQDAAKAKQATLGAISQGADIVIHQANAAAKGVFEACKEKQALALGANLNQNADPTGVVGASAIIIAGPAFLDLAQQVKAGSFKGGIVLKGMDSGSIDFVINPALQGRFSPDVLNAVEDAKQKILKGELVVPKDEF